MKKILKLYTLLSCLVTLTLLPAGSVKSSSLKKQTLAKKNELSSTSIETNSTNELLSAILDNAQLLVEHIQNNQPDKNTSKKSIKKITISEKKLSPEILSTIQEYTSIIKEEYKKFSLQHAPIKKYNTNTAEQALKNLAHAIKQATHNNAETIITQANKTIQNAIVETEKTITQAQKIINETELQLNTNEISRAHAAKIIGQQNYTIKSAKEGLKKLVEDAKNAITKSDIQTSYLSSMANQAYNAAAKALAPLKAGYGYSDEEKNLAREIIIQLQYALAAEVEQFQAFLNNNQLSPQQKQEIIAVHNKTMHDLQAELYQQQLITGDAMSTNRKLFWGTVALAGALGAGYLAYQNMIPSLETSSQNLQLPSTENVAEEVFEQETLNLQPSTLEQPIQQVQQTHTFESNTPELETKSTQQEIEDISAQESTEYNTEPSPTNDLDDTPQGIEIPQKETTNIEQSDTPELDTSIIQTEKITQETTESMPTQENTQDNTEQVLLSNEESNVSQEDTTPTNQINEEQTFNTPELEIEKTTESMPTQENNDETALSTVEPSNTAQLEEQELQQTTEIDQSTSTSSEEETSNSQENTTIPTEEPELSRETTEPTTATKETTPNQAQENSTTTLDNLSLTPEQLLQIKKELEPQEELVKASQEKTELMLRDGAQQIEDLKNTPTTRLNVNTTLDRPWAVQPQTETNDSSSQEQQE